MQRSEAINELAAALAKAQGQMKGAEKSAVNPFFKSKYADLAAVIEAIRKPFADNGLAYPQFARSTEAAIEIETWLIHSSGQYFSEVLTLPVAKWDPQELGKLITYGKRYGLQAMCGVPSEDDDGNSAAEASQSVRAKGMAILKAAVIKGTAELELAWKKAISAEMRAACKNDLEALKLEATKIDGEVPVATP